MSFQDKVPDAAVLEISAILVVDGDGDGLVALVDRYLAVLGARNVSYEVLVLYDDGDEGMRRAIVELSQRPHLTAIAPRPWGGEDEAIATGLSHAKGEIVVTLPGWPEIDPEEIDMLIDAIGEADMATGKRTGQRHSAARVALAHGLLELLFQQRLEDIFCRTRTGRREMFKKIADLGVRQHFLPLVAISEGYRVREIDVTPAENAVTPALHQLKPGSQISALVDLLSLYVTLKFLKRPLRFFGAIGVPVMLVGGLITAWLMIARLFFDMPLADRPALVFSVMLLVLGIQIIALGLVGEIIIFASSRRIRGYEIEKVLRGRTGGS